MLKARRRIRKAKETGALELSLRLSALTRLLPELEQLTSLQSLILDGCEQLSGDLSPLADLTSLQVARPILLSRCSPVRPLESLLPGLFTIGILNLTAMRTIGQKTR
jgi:hypothetical protein